MPSRKSSQVKGVFPPGRVCLVMPICCNAQDVHLGTCQADRQQGASCPIVFWCSSPPAVVVGIVLVRKLISLTPVQTSITSSYIVLPALPASHTRPGGAYHDSPQTGRSEGCLIRQIHCALRLAVKKSTPGHQTVGLSRYPFCQCDIRPR